MTSKFLRGVKCWVEWRRCMRLGVLHSTVRGGVLCLFVLWVSAAAPMGAEPLPRSDLPHLERLGVEDGLGHSTVRALHQDAYGFLWLATESYLQRYDGLEFRAFKHDPDDPHSLSESQVTAVTEDGQGRLWFGTRRNGLNLWLPGEERFRRYVADPDDPETLLPGIIWSMAEDHEGYLWVASSNGLSRLHPASGKAQRYRHQPQVSGSLGDDSVYALTVDRQGVLWIGDGAGLSRHDPGQVGFTHYRHHGEDPHSPSSDATGTVFVDAAGTLWVATWDGMLNRYRAASDDFLRLDPAPGLEGDGRGIQLVRQDAQGDLWLALESRGVIRYRPETGLAEHFEHRSGDPWTLASNRVWDVLEDRSGVLWLATENGLNRWVRQRAQFEVWPQGAIGRASRVPGVAVSALTEDAAGRLWVGMQGGALAVYGGDRPIYTWPAPSSEEAQGAVPERPTGMIRALQPSTDGDLWVGSDDGLWRLPGGEPGGTAQRLPNLRGVTCLLARGDGLWVGTGGGLFRHGIEDGSVERFEMLGAGPRRHAANRVYALAEAAEPPAAPLGGSGGTVSPGLWVATEDGFFRLDLRRDAAAEIHEVDAPQGQLLNFTALHVDGQGDVWLGSYGGGLNRWRPTTGEWRLFHEKDGLPSDKVVGILEADDGHLWLATNAGLSRFDPRTETFRNYDRGDGLHGDVSFIGTALRRRSGALVIGGPGGLTSFVPAQLRDDPHVPTVALTGLSLAGVPAPLASEDGASPLEQSILATSELTLTHRQPTFSLELAALHFANPARNRYAYRLRGYDDDWITTDARHRQARYTNLDPGVYVFEARASTRDGAWSDPVRSLAIHVVPPPWRSGWAYAVYLVCILASAELLRRWQGRRLAREQAINARLRQADRLKDQFLANTSHELRTPLQGITGLAESLLDGAAGRLSPRARSDLGLLLASGRRLGFLVDDLLDFAKLEHRELKIQPRPLDLQGMVQMVLSLSRPLVDEAEVELCNDVAADLPPVLADEHRLMQVLHNLIGNAIKYTPQGKIAISARVESPSPTDGGEPQWMRVEVRDSGLGIPEASQESIFEPFQQGEVGVDRRFGGTGLGLAVSRQLVALHGGTLSVRSRPGEGSTFVFTLPLASQAASSTETDPRWLARASRVAAVLSDGSSDGDGEAPRTVARRLAPADGPGRILVVDDEEINRRVLSNFLSAEGYEVTLAAGGADALDLAAHNDYDLILLDIMMPKVSGYDVCQVLRREHELANLPIIFLSAKIQADDVVTGLSVGGNDFLRKPIAKAELLARIRPHLALLSHRRGLDRLVDEKSSQIRTLGALVPICAICKDIRDDGGYWEEVETFLAQNSHITLSHGLCPTCFREHYSELDGGESQEI